jgi:hypothetical protein
MTATGSRKSSAPQPATSGRFGERPGSNSAEGVAVWEAAGVGDVGSSDRLAPEDREGSRAETRKPF